MLRTLRQLTPEEMRQVAAECGARPGAPAEEVVRSLARLCGAFTWGIFPAGTDDVLLDQVGRRLGLPPMTGGPRAIAMRERAVLVCFLRRAWEELGAARRRRLLEEAIFAWDRASAPPPDPPAAAGDAPEADRAALHVLFELMLGHSAGVRALAVASRTCALPLPESGPVSVIRSAVSGRGDGHQILYSVLLVLWRARDRILKERRAQRLHVEQQIRRQESLLAVRRRHLTAAPTSWERNPASGLSILAAASTSVAFHVALATRPEFLLPAAAVGAAGAAWSLAALLVSPRPTDQRIARMDAQVQALRSQLAQLDREILHLETE